MQTAQQNLVRKQIMLSRSNIKKLKQISDAQGTSVAEVVRLAVDSYNPTAEDMGDQELMALVSLKLKEAIKATDRASRTVRKTVKELEAR